jgi:hypothetical protein
VRRAWALAPTTRPRSATELEHALLQFCRPNFRDHMIERISQASIGFQSSSPLLPTPSAHATVVGKKKPMSKLPLVIAGVAAAGIAAATILAMKREDKPAPATVVKMPVDEPAVVATVPPPVIETPAAPVVEGSAAPAQVTIKLDVEPASAKVTIDGKPIEGAMIEVDQDDEVHKLSITAKGYQTYEEDLSFSEAQKLVVKLDKVGQRPRARPPKQPKPGKPERIDTKSPYD